MPHVDIRYFPKDLDDRRKNEMVADIVAVLKKHLGSSEDSVSVALHEILPEHWKAEVYDPIIMAQFDELVKKPGYRY